ncbi:phospholipase D-like domain-containing protein [Streptomyces sp. DSM 44915]|uniref:phospholipase D n=1 Tax=Streptomyces chisholmiae TaxID=3075540 RepID=A0ABU2JR94_9ACTN|nr:phospholipase D-like domain-containing protein [Streptomyces sp. DSM 44915]MDT0267264.1 phospholipase D-like domain-containing protein [Streptomyces sp. DSM 44915]
MAATPRPTRLRAPAPVAALAALAALVSAQFALAPAANAALEGPAASACRDAAEVPVATGAVFNDPVAGTPTAVVAHLCSLIKQAPAGSSIELAQFVISGDAGADFVEVLLDAHRRGVDVRVVMDGYQMDNPAAQAMLAGLGQDRSARSWVHVCSHLSPEGNTSSCQGTKGQHNKFYLFSETGGRRDVVVQASNNLTDVNSRTYWNNAVVLPGNGRLFDAYGAYFADLAAEVQDPDYYRTVTTGMRGGRVTAHFFPSAEVDPIVERLDGIGCKRNGRTQVDVGMSEWDAERVAIAELLAGLAAEGCRVRVAHGPLADEVAAVLDASGVERRLLDGSTEAGRVHSKYTVVRDATGRGSGRGFVLTGSHNFNATSLYRNDEALVDVALPEVVASYAANFERLWEVGAAPRG